MFVTSVFPATATVSWDIPTTFWEFQEVAEYEINKYRIIVEDKSMPLSVNYLNVIQGADAGAAKSPVTGVQATAGNYEGATFANFAVMFAKTLGQAFNGLSYTVPSAVTTHYVTGLTPNTGYTVVKTVAGTVVNVNITAGGPTLADSAGVLSF
jgi:hypothetical protein